MNSASEFLGFKIIKRLLWLFIVFLWCVWWLYHWPSVLVASCVLYFSGVVISAFAKDRPVLAWTEQILKSTTTLLVDGYKNIHDAMYGAREVKRVESESIHYVVSLGNFVLQVLVLFAFATGFWLLVGVDVPGIIFDSDETSPSQQSVTVGAVSEDVKLDSSLLVVGKSTHGTYVEESPSADRRTPESLFFQGLLDQSSPKRTEIVFGNWVEHRSEVLSTSDSRIDPGFYLAAWNLSAVFPSRVIITVESNDFEPLLFVTGTRLNQVIGSAALLRDPSKPRAARVMIYIEEGGHYNIFLTSRLPGGFGRYWLTAEAIHE